MATTTIDSAPSDPASGRTLSHAKTQSSFHPFRSALLLRYALLNILATAALGVAYLEGYVQQVIDADQTYLSVVIFLAFAVGLMMSTWRAWQISQDIDTVNEALRKDSTSKMADSETVASSHILSNAPQGAKRMRLAQRIALVRHIANTLVLLGLIGTVLGFIIALSGVDPTGASDVTAIAPMVSTLIQGMSTALYTTLIGSIFNVWLMANYQLLSGGTVELMSAWLQWIDSDA